MIILIREEVKVNLHVPFDKTIKHQALELVHDHLYHVSLVLLPELDVNLDR